MVIKWLTPAMESLNDIVMYYKKEFAENAARRIVSKIRISVEKLKEFPELASIEPLLEKRTKEYRSLISTKTYKVIYYIDKRTIFIADIWDCRQNPRKLKDRIKEK